MGTLAKSQTLVSRETFEKQPKGPMFSVKGKDFFESDVSRETFLVCNDGIVPD